MTRLVRLSAYIGIILVTSAAAQAASVPVPNGDFETSLQTYTNVANADLGGGWTRLNASGMAYSGMAAFDAAEYTVSGSASGGHLMMKFQNTTNAQQNAKVKSPALGVAGAELLIEASKVYTITFAAGNPLGMKYIGAPDNQSRNGLEVLLDGTAKAVERVWFGDATTSLTAPPTGTDGTWVDYSVSFTTDESGVVTESTGDAGWSGYTMPTLVGQTILGQALRLQFRIDGYSLKQTGGSGAEFDNVRLDITSLLPPEPTWHLGDANKDNSVDLQDFGLLKENFGATENAAWEQGDFNADGGVDLQDFGILKEHFGHTVGDPAITAVPEPATMSLLALAGLGLIRRKR